MDQRFMGIQGEILLPEVVEERADRDARGRFTEGHPGGKGKPPGALSFNTRAVRDAIAQALDAVSGGDGGVNYFMVLAASRPDLFMPMLAKCMPILQGDDAGIVVRQVTRTIVDRRQK